MGLLRLPNLFRIDGALSLVFGLATASFQYDIFSTAVDLSAAGWSDAGESLIGSALLTLSGYYALVGAMLLALARIPAPFSIRLAALAAIHHAWMGAKGVIEADRPWLTGSPWWDVAIHSAFVLAYAILVVPQNREDRSALPRG
jgi:hypothetical protein